MRQLNAPPSREDYLRLFELQASWSPNDLKAAFLRLAKKYHPDANPGDREADAHFKFVNQAYESLSRLANRPASNDEQGVTPASTQQQSQPAKSEPKKAGVHEMASSELNQKLKELIEAHRLQNMKVEKPTGLKKLRNWVNNLFTGK
jgi:DnaJ-class molecular chaperone